MVQEKDIFNRSELLVGPAAMDKIKKARVILFGLGGVGSWCAESLVRSGISHLTIVDSDCISVSNINRQLPATTDTIGLAKAEVLKTRLHTINPHAKIISIQSAYTEKNNDMFNLGAYDYIIDAIDSLEHKASLIINATCTKAVLFSSMGAALKLDTSHVQTAEFWKVSGCPMAAALRRRFKKNGLPAKKFQCVFSDEVLENKGYLSNVSTNQYGDDISYDKSDHFAFQSVLDERKARINGAMVHITAIFGFTLAGLVIQDITGLTS